MKIVLEWFLNPDHLPFIVAKEKFGADIELIEPKEHYDGFEALKREEIDIALNEPLHLLEQHSSEMLSLGCFFKTSGGVMLKNSSIEKLFANEKIEISTPVSNEITNKIGFEILRRFAKENSVELERDSVQFVEKGFYHIENMRAGCDGAWLCFENFEGVEARLNGLDVIMLDEKYYPNFSALDIYTTKALFYKNRESFLMLLKTLKASIEYIENSREEAKELYYSYSKEQKSTLMDEILESTLDKFLKDIPSNPEMYKSLYEFLYALDITDISEDEFKDSFLI
jgi:ABC-type nitrate/sulfonate/bicarbonate transport system substrate-binding protein